MDKPLKDSTEYSKEEISMVRNTGRDDAPSDPVPEGPSASPLRSSFEDIPGEVIR